MTKREFDIGDRVKVVSKHGRTYYFYSLRNSNNFLGSYWSPDDIPLGANGKVVQRNYCHNSSCFKVKIKDKAYLFHISELAYDNEIESIPLTEKESRSLDTLLGGEEMTIDSKSSVQREFKPKFNAREEFAVWVRQEFPELKEYIQNQRVYDALIHRKSEVIRALREVEGHINKTTTGTTECVLGTFESLLSTTDLPGFNKFSISLNQIVSYIEKTSANLSDPASRHYGTELREAK